MANESARRERARFRKRIATEIVPAGAFYPAEEYHQWYLEKLGTRRASCRLPLATRTPRQGGMTMSEQSARQQREEADLPTSEAEWRMRLSPEQFEVLRNKGTERAFTGKYAFTKERGTYQCAACGAKLFRSEARYDSGTGWPSFFQPIDPGAVEFDEDRTFGMVRTEVTCARCGSHLGHLFFDGPRPTGERYCMNSISLDLEPDEIAPVIEGISHHGE